MNVKEEQKRHLSHMDKQGDARMVDVGGKQILHRTARASGLICLAAETIEAIRDDQLKKGNVLAVARIAGIQAAKATPDLIPLCHILPLDSVCIDFEFRDEGILASCEVSCQARTGVEMEALTGVSVALLTVYDMCKAIDGEMVLDQIRLIHKEKEEPTA
ncbi:MAG: cyclic pyranopterin monophosphate synthase MoaC [Bacteroidales bacterium]|nr:cyclic pyranopterin monophosphate synthase MoaC [Bacteroidales bacterium]